MLHQRLLSWAKFAVPLLSLLGSLVLQAALSGAFCVVASGTVNLAAYLVKAIRRGLASRASGMLVTSFYLPARWQSISSVRIAGRAGWRWQG
jgi:hypothetical protein